MTKPKTINIGTVFSGIGAFEHALKQLHIQHKILFACDNGERELPLTYGDLYRLTKGVGKDELYAFCEEYINRIGVRKDLRKLETDILLGLAQNPNMNPTAKVIIEYHKQNRKSKVKHIPTLTQEQIIALTPNISMKERDVCENFI